MPEELPDGNNARSRKKGYVSYTRPPVSPSGAIPPEEVPYVEEPLGVVILSDPREQFEFLRNLPHNCEIIDITDDVTLPPSHLNVLTMQPGAVLFYHGQLLKGGRAYKARARQPEISGLGVLQSPVYTLGQPFPNAVSIAAQTTLTTAAPSKDKRLIAVEIVFWTTALRVARASGVAFSKNITLYDVYRPGGRATNVTSIILNALTGSTASDVVIQRNITIPKEHEFEVIISAVANCFMDFFLTYVMES